ncbi:AFR548Cp [Eremothecium gossypii ATCC 10895]|uniref:aromatic-amino-acid transaminase n=1 Tax=Eremothecium gossypii (strain ATCC 10895 / CBS 109.51 / FGSC 9923 / NRRL Y-1056) TaxID=284811 RepID=Q752M6_EREGS|nr:AFR548Cp [Eremothecium gossypii ATCC 10895]AAS53919.1 AFR548Cp [Eremothecium gossypii ATCC 10895]AEY98232.1 FAFR548Cp [Eremothecium gossypii FDAG1]
MTVTLPPAQDFSYKFSEETKARIPSPLKTCLRYYNDPDIIFLGGGLPRSELFPWDSVSASCAAPPFKTGTAGGMQLHVAKSGQSANAVVSGARDVPLERALQYGFSQGQPELMDFVREHTRRLHRMQYADWDVLATVGNTSAWESTLRVFCNRGDTILAEEYTFSSSLVAAEAQGVRAYPVPLDENGMVPERLGELLDNWERWHDGVPRPKLLYTVPTGQNPTGTCLSNDRRQAVYRLAQQHDLLIVEDEPYYFLQLDPYEADAGRRAPRVFASHEEFVGSLVRSFLSLDTDGRVLRLDSFSKVLAPGTRLGWIAGAKQLLQAYLALLELTVQAPSGFTSSLIAGTLTRWGQEHYIDWLIELRREYTHLRDVVMDALHRYIPAKPWVRVNPTEAGMFFTVHLNAAAHPRFVSEYESQPERVEWALYEKMIAHGVLAVPGMWFRTGGKDPSRSRQAGDTNNIFFRGTFAAVEEDKLVVGIQRLGSMLAEEFGCSGFAR